MEAADGAQGFRTRISQRGTLRHWQADRFSRQDERVCRACAGTLPWRAGREAGSHEPLITLFALTLNYMCFISEG